MQLPFAYNCWFSLFGSFIDAAFFKRLAISRLLSRVGAGAWLTIHFPPKGCTLLLWIIVCMFARGRPLCTELLHVGVWKPNYLAPGTDILDEVPCWGAPCPSWHFYYKLFLLLLAQLHLLQGNLADPNLTFYVYPMQDSHISLSPPCLRHSTWWSIIPVPASLCVLIIIDDIECNSTNGRGGWDLKWSQNSVRQESVLRSLVPKCTCFGKIILIFEAEM